MENLVLELKDKENLKVIIVAAGIIIYIIYQVFYMVVEK